MTFLVLFQSPVAGVALTPNNMRQAQLLRSPILRAKKAAVTPATMTQAQTLSVGAMIEKVYLVPRDLRQRQVLYFPVLTQHNVLTVNGLEQTQSLEVPLLVQHSVLTPEALSQPQSLEAVELIQHSILEVDNIGQWQFFETITISLYASLDVFGLSQAQTLDSVNLTMHFRRFTPTLWLKLDEPVITNGTTAFDSGSGLGYDGTAWTYAGSYWLAQQPRLTPWEGYGAGIDSSAPPLTGTRLQVSSINGQYRGIDLAGGTSKATSALVMMYVQVPEAVPAIVEDGRITETGVIRTAEDGETREIDSLNPVTA
jgi:hypothetical protein